MVQKIVLYTENRLYDHPVRILLAHKHREYEVIPTNQAAPSISNFKRLTDAPVYFEKGEVPFVSCETIGTETYVDERFAGNHVLPSDVQNRYRMVFTVGEIVNTLYPLFDDIDANWDEITTFLKGITSYMDASGHIWSHELTFIDIFLLPALWRLRKHHPDFQSSTSPLNAYARNYFTHPSFVNSLTPEDDEDNSDEPLGNQAVAG